MGKGPRSVGTAARPLEFHLGAWESLQWICMQAGISSLSVFLVCSGQGRWEVPTGCLEWLWQPQFLSRNAPCSLDQSMRMTQIQSSTEASSPGPRDAPRLLLATTGARAPRTLHSQSRQFPLPSPPLATSGGAGGEQGKKSPPSGQQRSPRPGEQSTDHPWLAAEESTTHL